jgi:hypothetical protein
MHPRRRKSKKRVRMMRRKKATKGRMSLNITILSLFLDIARIRIRKPDRVAGGKP